MDDTNEVLDATGAVSQSAIGWGAFVAMASCILLLWAGAWWFAVIAFRDWPTRGQFGDTFGAVNSLFSGLAFAGVIYTIWLQRTELELQRQELRFTRDELKRSAAAQEESTLIMRSTLYAQTYRAVIELLQNEETREARATVINLADTNPNGLSITERAAVEKVCHTYDAVGQMIRSGLLPLEYIIGNWGDSLRRTWPRVEPLVREYRSVRDAPETWDDYEYLAHAAFEHAKSASQND